MAISHQTWLYDYMTWPYLTKHGYMTVNIYTVVMTGTYTMHTELEVNRVRSLNAIVLPLIQDPINLQNLGKHSSNLGALLIEKKASKILHI